MKNSDRHRKIVRFRRVVRGVSPVLAVLLMIAIAVIAAIVAYMWVMGYFRSTASRVDKAIQIQSAAYTGSHLVIYVQNVGQGTVRFIADQCFYVDGVLQEHANINPNTLTETETATIIDQISLGLTQTIKIKVVTDEGTSVEAFVTINTFTGDYTLTLLIIGNGHVDLVPSGGAYYYDNVQLTAVADSHWTFSGWSGGLSGPTNPVDILVDRDIEVTATFEQYEFQVVFDQTGLSNAATGTVVTVNIGSTVYQESFSDLPFTTPWVDTGTEIAYSYAATVPSGTSGEQFIYSGVTGPTSPITVTSDDTVTGNYGIRYYFTVSSPYATVGGEGWYDSGDTAYASLDVGSVDHGNETRHVFTRWSGDSAGTSYDQSDSITMDAPKTAVADWKTQYLVSFAASPPEGGTTIPGTDSWYDVGATDVPIDATTSLGYAFSSWSSSTPDIAIANESAQSTTVTTNAPGTITATFTRIEYTLTVDANPLGSGNVIPNNTGPYYYGDVVELNAVPTDPSWGFSAWSGDLTGITNPATIVIDGNKTVTAAFSQQTFVIQASVAGGLGNILPSGDVVVTYGSDQGFTFTPNTGYRVDDVAVDMVSQGPMDSYNFTNVITDHSISVFFARITYTITASAGSGGTISPSGSVTVDYGDYQSFTITPDTGYHVADVLVDAVSQGSISFYNFTNVVANHTISASFAINTYTINAFAGLGGSVVPNGTIIVTYGADQSFTITPDAGYHVDNVAVDSQLQGSITSYTFHNVTENHAILVSFAQDEYTLTVVMIGNGAGTVTKIPNQATYHYGNSVQLTASANLGSYFAGWSGDISGTTNPVNITMNGNKTVTATFTQNTYGITINIVGQGSVSRNATEPYVYGQAVNLTATPQAGWSFSGWSGDLAGSANPATVTMTSNKTVTATFTQNTYTLTASVVGQGSVLRNNTGPYYYGDVVQLTAVPTSGWSFSGWSGDLTGSANPTIILINGNKAVTATFNISTPVTVTLLRDGFEGKWADPDWDRTTYYHHSGSYSAMSVGYVSDDHLGSYDINAAGGTAITVDFWYRLGSTETGDLILQFYNGTSYVQIATFGGETENTWLHNTTTTTDSQYFKSNFRIRFVTNLSSSENICVDDVTVTVTGTSTTFADGFETDFGATWNANWNAISSNWYQSSTEHSDDCSAASSDGNEGNFTCNPLDANNAIAIHVDFYYRLDSTEDTDLMLYFYNGSNYVIIANLGGGTKDPWLHYTATITDSQYFKSNFRIRFVTNLSSSENIWIDDVTITKDVLP